MEYAPAAQARHHADELRPEAVEKRPAAHKLGHVAAASPATVEYEPAAHSWHAELPVALLV